MARYRRSFSGVSRKTLSEYKWGLALVSFLAIVLVFLAVVTKGFTNWDAKTWFGNEVTCEHVFENGVCTECEFECEHEFEDGKCITCEGLEVDLKEETEDEIPAEEDNSKESNNGSGEEELNE